jgi:translation initiation factor IF-1
VSVRIAGRSGVHHLRFWHEAGQDTEGEILDLRGDLQRGLAVARSLTSGPAAMAAVRKLLVAELTGLPRLDDAEVVRRLGAALAAGRVLAVRVPAPALPTFDLFQAEPPPAAETPLPKREEKTWIEIELVDTEGKPVPGERYSILLPDGKSVEGRLDASGKAYFAGLDPGECDVTFPDLDNDAVAAPGEPAKPKGRPLPKRQKKTWVEIELIGMDGNPISNELYRIALPDGTSVEGRLNERGRARVIGIDPGTCTVTFPELDMEAWEPVEEPT